MAEASTPSLPDTRAARAAILARVRGALGTAQLPRSDIQAPPSQSLESAEAAEWVARFLAELGQIDVPVHRESEDAAVRERVRRLIGDQRLLSWDPAALPYGLEEIVAASSQVSAEASAEVKEGAEVGLSGVDAAIAETGTLVLLSECRHPRSATLLPPRHIAVVRPADLVPTLGAWLRRAGPSLRDFSCANLVTGPSRTADIELTLTLGVHGPRELIVVMGP